MAVSEEDGDFLRAPSDQKYAALERASTTYKPHESYALEKEKQYQQQFGDMYFFRLAKLKPAVEKIALDAWDDFQIAGETVQKVERVLDVRQGRLCWVIGTIYMEMPLKPNILDDISKDVGRFSVMPLSRAD
ncbi:DNA polymerase subunit delta-2 [Lachnellula suecica]|uniref:DNA polymerase subunit delta-2 n=1 Tax=Lachnellula suecica TaxID=602035 RepID=A0A8T9C8M5_9HELO|nr:DNA polymerase subunit delta-2 [Lachnellula suecica]